VIVLMSLHRQQHPQQQQQQAEPKRTATTQHLQQMLTTTTTTTTLGTRTRRRASSMRARIFIYELQHLKLNDCDENVNRCRRYRDADDGGHVHDRDGSGDGHLLAPLLPLL